MKRFVERYLIVLLVIGVAGTIWMMIPAILKIAAIVLLIFAVIGIFKSN